mgnify:CR=1 FL=1
MALVECGFELIDDPKHLGRMNPRNQDDWGTTTNEEEVRGQQSNSNGERKESSAKSSIRNEYDSLHEKVSKIQKRRERASRIWKSTVVYRHS